MLSLLYIASIIGTVQSAVVFDPRAVPQQVLQEEHWTQYRQHENLIPGTALAALQSDAETDVIRIDHVDLDFYESQDIVYGALSMQAEVMQDIGPRPVLYWTLYHDGSRTLQRKLDLHQSLSHAPAVPGGVDLKQIWTVLEEPLHEGSFELSVFNLAAESLVLPGWYTVRVEMRDSLGDLLTHFKVTRWLDGYGASSYDNPSWGDDENEDDQRLMLR